MNGQPQSLHNISVFLLGAMINTLAVIDIQGLLEYSLKAFVGGCIWLGFKILSDFIGDKMNQKKSVPKSNTDSLNKFLNQ